MGKILEFDKGEKILRKIILICLSLASLVGVYFFLPSGWLKIFLSGIILITYLASFIFKKYPILIFLTFFLSIFSLYNFYYSFSTPIWLTLIFSFILSATLFYLFSHFLPLPFPTKVIFLSFLFSLCLIIGEVFLALSFWPTSPQNKGLVMLVVFYLYGNFTLFWLKNSLTGAKIREYLILAGIIIIILLFSASWYGV